MTNAANITDADTNAISPGPGSTAPTVGSALSHPGSSTVAASLPGPSSFQIDHSLTKGVKAKAGGDRHRNRRTGDTVYLFVPAAFDITQYPELDKTGIRESALWFLHHILAMQAKANTQSFVAIPYASIIKVISEKTVGAVLRHLVSYGIVERTEYRFSTGSINYNRCRKWMLSKKFIGRQKMMLIDYKPLVKKVNLNRLASTTLTNSATPPEIFSHLLVWLQKTTISPAYCPTDDQDLKKVATFKTNPYISSCKYGRVHTNITSLRGECRKHLEIDGQKLVEIDIVNSQPVFVAQLYKKARLADEGYDGKFEALCASGEIYDYLMAKVGLTDRAQFKTELFKKVLYANKYPAKPGPLLRLFAAEFPHLFAFIHDQQEAGVMKLACQMQKAESALMIAGVCGHFAQHHPEVPLITVHDAVLTTPQYVEMVKKQITKEFAIKGMTVTLKEKQ